MELYSTNQLRQPGTASKVSATLSGVDLCRSLVGLGTCECGKTKANNLTQNESAAVQISLPASQSNV